MTPTELEKLEALHAAATPGEWRADIDRDRLTVDLTSYQQTGDEPHDWIAPYVAGFEASDGGVADCEAIAAIHNAFPAMAKALREAQDEREEAVEALENLEGVIRDNIPYYYDQGEADEDEANPEECVEYAAADIAKLKADVEKLRHLLARLIEEGTQDTHSISSECIRLVEAEIKGYEYTLPER